MRFCQKPLENPSRLHQSDDSQSCCSRNSKRSGRDIRLFQPPELLGGNCLLLFIIIHSAFWYCHSFLGLFNFRQTFADIATSSPQKKISMWEQPQFYSQQTSVLKNGFSFPIKTLSSECPFCMLTTRCFF